MHSTTKYALAFAALTFATQALAQQITFFGRENFEGGSVSTDREVGSLERSALAGRAASAVVSTDWEVCSGPGFTGRCVLLLPGEYPTFREFGLSDGVASARQMSRNAPIADPRYPLVQPGPQITIYEQPGFQGPSYLSDRPIASLPRRASSVVVLGDSWEVCDGERFSGRCVVLPPGRYPSFGVIGLNAAISSMRPVH